jgi:hypothetical protein
MKPISDVQLIAIACCGLFLLAVYISVNVSEIDKRLNKIIEILENRP